MQKLQKQTISELYTDDKSKYSSSPENIFKSAKDFYETIYTKEKTYAAATTELLTKIPNRKKNLMNNLTLWGENIFRWDHKIGKSQTNESPCKEGLTAEL